MSGHSKWATIHRDKEVNDSKRGVAFTKFAHAITIAARQREDYKLRLIIEKARAINMPKDNIQRAIDRAAVTGVDGLEEFMFEGFAPGGVAVMIATITDNKLRTAQQVRGVLEKGGGSLGSKGSVAYLFSVDMKPNFELVVKDTATRAKVEAVLEKLTDLDDVTQIWTNYA